MQFRGLIYCTTNLNLYIYYPKKMPMKNLITSSRIISSIIAGFGLVFSFQASAQNAGWKAKPFDHRMFIENKGQFDDGTDNKNIPVRFGARVQGTLTYFTANGVTYRQDEVILLNQH